VTGQIARGLAERVRLVPGVRRGAAGKGIHAAHSRGAGDVTPDGAHRPRPGAATARRPRTRAR
jgi:hypothetical protein